MLYLIWPELLEVLNLAENLPKFLFYDYQSVLWLRLHNLLPIVTLSDE